MTNTINKIAVGYVRVSTTMQAEEGHSLEAQQQSIFDYCRYQKLEFSRFYRDEAISGGHMDRPQLTKMLEELQPGNVVIVVSISRLSRSIKDTQEIIGIIRSKGASLCILDLNVDTSTATGELMLNMMASFAQFERKQTAERISTTMSNMAREGKLVTKPSFGYKVIKDGKVSQVVEDPDEQAVINTIRTILHSDPVATPTQIAKLLSTQGIRIRKSKTIRGDFIKKIIDTNNLRPVVAPVVLPGPNYI